MARTPESAAVDFAESSLFTGRFSILALAACGQKDPGTDAPAQNGDSEQTEPADTSAQPEEPQPEPYTISSPTIDRGTVDGVTYVPWDGIVEHLFFHPIVAYPELALTATRSPTALTTGW